MSIVNAEWALSKKAALELFAQTGVRPDIVNIKLVDLDTLSVEQRRVLLQQAYNPGTEKLSKIDIHGQKSGFTTYPADLSTRDYPIEFDAEPTIEQIVEALTRLSIIAAERKIEASRKAEAERVRFEKQKADEARVKADLKAMENAIDLEGAKAYALPSDDPRLKSYKDGSIRSIAGKLNDIEKERWIVAHGSTHLKRAFTAGYDCQRLYVVERGALEAPGWIVDYNGTGRESSRACPSMAAMEIEEAAISLAQQIGTSTPSVAWLTEPPTNQPKGARNDDWDEEVFEECEVVRMKGYLGMYELYKIVEQ